ncbi:MAG: hypothetical protein ABIO70_16110 [Pseudomonadota bacterium]
MSTIELQKRLLADAALRKRFAKDPEAVLVEFEVKLPEGIKVPESLDLNTVNEGVRQFKEDLDVNAVDIAELNLAPTAELSSFIEKNLPVRGRDLPRIARIHETLAGAGGGEVALVAGVAVVVAAVVAAAGAVADVEKLIRPEMGIEGITRTGRGLTLHLPNGLRIEGLGIEEVADLIGRIR